MKFGKQLELNKYLPWNDYYIQYNRLKRIITRRKFIKDKLEEKEINNEKGGLKHSVSYLQMTQLMFENKSKEPPLMLDETTPILIASRSRRSSSSVSKNNIFSYNEVDIEIDDNNNNNNNIDQDIYNESIDFFLVINQEIEKINTFLVGKISEIQVSIDNIMNKRNNPYLSHHSGGDPIDLKKLQFIYIECLALKSYCELNSTGFYKIIKKFDKVLGENVLDSWMEVINKQFFVATSEPQKLVEIVSSLVSVDKLLLWDKFASELSKNKHGLFPSVNYVGLIISIGIFILSIYFPIIKTDDPAIKRCLSLLLLTILLWVTESIPYYCTSLLIPALVIFLGVMKDPFDKSQIMKSEQVAKFVVENVFNHITFLLLGGYTISSAFSRCQLELQISSILQEFIGHKPQLFILAVMFLGLFLSMLINNHTAPILTTTILLPIVRDLPTNSRFSKALLLGLAFSCNFGGMMTPISSLQNALASSSLNNYGIKVSFICWISIALPFCIICVVSAWLVLMYIIKPDDVKSIPVIVYEKGTSGISSIKKYVILSFTLLCIIGFATSSFTNNIFGDVSIISILYMAIMFGTGLLTEIDFNSLSWHTLVLVGGGNVLGKSIESSGLLSFIANGIIQELPLNYPTLAMFYIFCFVALVATFVSHTVASIILMPIISQIGIKLNIPEVIVIGSAFSISAAMALPFSSFPNVNCLLIVDDFQKSYLNVKDFMIAGTFLTIATILLISTFGEWLIDTLTSSNL